MGEGAGMLVLETLEHARARGAEPLVELIGYGTSADAYHLTAGPEDGSGAARAMTAALAQAGLSPDQVQHLNAHATSTPVGDKGELEAIKSVFGRASKVAVTSTKSAIGHLLGAAGGVEAIFTALALRDQLAPATLNLEDPDSGRRRRGHRLRRRPADADGARDVERLRLRRSQRQRPVQAVEAVMPSTLECQVRSAKCQVELEVTGSRK